MNKNIVNSEIIFSIITGTIGCLLFLVFFDHFCEKIPLVFSLVFTLPITLCMQLINKINDNITDSRGYLKTTEVNRYYDSVLPIKKMLHGYFWLFILSSIFTGWALFKADASYAIFTLPIVSGLFLVGLRFIYVVMNQLSFLSKIKDDFKADLEHKEKLKALESNLTD